MLFELLFDIIFSLIGIILNFIPVLMLPANLVSALGSALQFLYNVSYFVPIGTIFISVAWLLSLDNFNILFNWLNWLIKKIPTI